MYCVEEPRRKRIQEPLITKKTFQNCTAFGIATLIHPFDYNTSCSEETVFELTSEFCDKHFPITDVNFRRCSNYKAIIDSVNRLIHRVLNGKKADKNEIPSSTAYPLCPVIDNVLAYMRGSVTPTVVKEVYPPIPSYCNDECFTIDHSESFYIDSLEIEALEPLQLNDINTEAMAVTVFGNPILVLASQ
jgi:hypothetical protein